jgi:hypothetical protein
VKGKPYNTPHEVVGVIAAINPGEETCNCLVLFLEMTDASNVLPYNIFETIMGHDGVSKACVLRSDYGEVRAFEKVL